MRILSIEILNAINGTSAKFDIPACSPEGREDVYVI
jgi:hypothetical protein